MSSPAQAQGPIHSFHTHIPQKCDAKRPCSTCVKADGGISCFYEELRTPGHVIRSLEALNPAAAIPDSDGLPGTWGDDLEHVSSLLRDEAAETGGQSQSLHNLQTGSSVPDPPGRDPTKLPSLSHRLLGSEPSETSLAVRPRPRHTLLHHSASSSRLSVLPSLRLPIIPPSPYGPLSFSCPENFQVAGEASGNLEMTLCASPIVFNCR